MTVTQKRKRHEKKRVIKEVISREDPLNPHVINWLNGLETRIKRISDRISQKQIIQNYLSKNR